MDNSGDETELTKAVPLSSDATGVIPVTESPETGELAAIDASTLSGGGSAYLVVRRGAMEGMQFPLAGGEKISIGRASDSKIFLDDVTVSRKHALVELVGEGWTLSDAGSLNGTYVNKARVATTQLNNGDELQIGKFRFVFLLATDAGQ
jgi:hypothetical protein